MRRELYELAKTLNCLRLKELADELERRQRAVRAKPTSTPMSRDIKVKIKQLKAEHPDWPQHRIASELGISQGRVSETLSGLRT